MHRNNLRGATINAGESLENGLMRYVVRGGFDV